MKRPVLGILGVIVFLMITTSSALDLHMTQVNDPLSTTCAQLNCTMDVTAANPMIFSIVSLAIYDVAQDNSTTKIASISTMSNTATVEPNRQGDVTATGSLSRFHAHLDLALSNGMDCTFGTFMCEANYADIIGQNGLLQVRESANAVSKNTSCCDLLDRFESIFNQTISQMTATVALLTGRVDNLMVKVGRTDDLEADLENRTNMITDELTRISDRANAVEQLLTNRIDGLQIQLLDVTNNTTFLESQITNRSSVLEDKLLQANSHVSSIESRLMNRTAELEAKLQTMTVQPIPMDLLNNHTADLNKLTNSVTVLETKLNTLSTQLNQALQGQGQACNVVATSCTRGMTSSAPRVTVRVLNNTTALCDTQTNGGGWIVIQRRANGSQDFYQNWNAYRDGFGCPSGDYWLGNENVHQLTASGPYELWVDLTFNGVQYHAQYSNFHLGDENSGYALTVSGYSGDAGDSLFYHNSMAFSTYDRDNDLSQTNNCALDHEAGWWYKFCYMSNLNGKWGMNSADGVSWDTLAKGMSVSFSEMKIRHL